MSIAVGDKVKVNVALIEERHAITLYDTIRCLKENQDVSFVVRSRIEKGNKAQYSIEIPNNYRGFCHIYEEDELILV